MALYDSPPHRVDTYTVAATRDDGGGTLLAYTLAQSAVPCSINTASSDTIDLFARDQIKVTHTVGFKLSAVSPALTPGMKLVAADTSESYHVKGISSGRQYGTIAPLLYAHCEQLL